MEERTAPASHPTQLPTQEDSGVVRVSRFLCIVAGPVNQIEAYRKDVAAPGHGRYSWCTEGGNWADYFIVRPDTHRARQAVLAQYGGAAPAYIRCAQAYKNEIDADLMASTRELSETGMSAEDANQRHPFDCWALVWQGVWHERGQALSFGRSAKALRYAEWTALLTRLYDAMPPGILLTCFDCHT